MAVAETQLWGGSSPTEGTTPPTGEAVPAACALPPVIIATSKLEKSKPPLSWPQLYKSMEATRLLPFCTKTAPPLSWVEVATAAEVAATVRSVVDLGGGVRVEEVSCNCLLSEESEAGS